MTATLPFASEMVATQLVPPTGAGSALAELKARAKALKKHRKHEGRRFFHGLCWCLHALGFSF